jgi:triacylglycerol esterase/lipase EstA (alpha/beta hydrolase family)
LVLGVLATLVVGVGVILGLILTRSSGPARSAAATTPGPVIAVPGYGGSTSSLTALANALRQAGRDVRIMSLPGDGRGDLGQQARALAAFAAKVRAETGAPSVDVVGYSAGGVVARLWVRNYGGAYIARRVVTLGSPHHGTNLASIADGFLPDSCPVACQQLAPGSAFLAALNAGNETPDGPQFVSIWTNTDNVVVPPGSAALAGATNIAVQNVCPSVRIDHGTLPSAPVVDRMVLRELGAGPPAALTTGDASVFPC